MGGLISDRDELSYYWRRGILAHNDDHHLYYDPRNDSLHDASGAYLGEPDDYFEDPSMELFRHENGKVCQEYQDLYSRRIKRRRSSGPERWREGRYESEGFEGADGITNFLVLGIMSTCAKTDHSGSNAKTNWEKQRPCNFAIRSVEENRCMYWCGSIDGHCSSNDAYAHKRGQKSFSRTELVKKQEIDEERSNPEHHFKRAERITVDQAQQLYSYNKLTEIINRKTQDSLFYYEDWDVYLNKYGKFLRELTEYKRKHDVDYIEVAQKWVKDLDVGQ